MNKREHLTLIAMEECAEIQQALSKSLRFGMEGSHGYNNEADILTEYYQLQAVVEEMIHRGILRQMSNDEIEHIKYVKLDKVQHFEEKCQKIGTVQPEDVELPKHLHRPIMLPLDHEDGKETVREAMDKFLHSEA